jgi:alpha-glucosidase (family GH31 glycosyl hydrolase)
MVQIIHTPFGQEHPYQQLPQERFPRLPLAGQPFKVGIVTQPSGAVHRLVIHQTVEGQALPDVAVTLIPDWVPPLEEGVGAEYLERVTHMDQDVWEAPLTAPAPGETLHYWIETETGECTEAYSLRGESWQAGGSVTLDDDSMRVSSAGQAAAPGLAGAPSLAQVEWLTDGIRARRVRLTFKAAAAERFYGLGERFNALDQRGNIMDIRIYEQYKNQGKRAYMPIPFLLSSAGYGVWVDSSRWMQFDLAATASDVWTLEADLGSDETLRLEWFTGADPITLISRFTRRTGPAALPPLWAFGLWMSSNEWNSQARVVREVEASVANEIAPSVVVIEAWSDESTFYIWNDAEYTPKSGSDVFRYEDFTFPAEGKWTDPKAMIDWLHAQDIKLVLWQIPVMKRTVEAHAQQDADRAYFEDAGLGVKNPDGSLYLINPSWFRGGYVWDATNPAARDWWFSKRAYLLQDMGVDGFKTDGGEHIWGTQLRFGNGRAGDEVWNEYPRHYTEAYYQFANTRPGGDGLLFSRAGYTGSQRSPAHWAGDEASTWEAYRHSVLAGLNAGISGIPFWSWDIGGFSGPIPTAELYLRAAAMAAFCPIMQYHSEFNAHRQPHVDRTPWNMQERTGDERVVPIFRQLLNVRHNLMPYLWQEAQHSAASGEPMMRAAHLTDAEASPYDYFFGRDLFVSPVVEEGVTQWTVKLPEGEWVDLWTRQPYAGGLAHTLDTPLDVIPVFVRAGARLPVRLGESQTLGEFVPLSAEPNAWLAF